MTQLLNSSEESKLAGVLESHGLFVSMFSAWGSLGASFP